MENLSANNMYINRDGQKLTRSDFKLLIALSRVKLKSIHDIKRNPLECRPLVYRNTILTLVFK